MDAGFITTLIGWIGALPDYINALIALSVGLAAVATVTPTKLDDRWIAKIGPFLTTALNIVLRVKEIGGLNVGKAKNEDDNV